MKKLLAAVLALLLLAMIGCSPAEPDTTEPAKSDSATGRTEINDVEPTEPVADKYANVKVAALTCGVITDQGWSQSIYMAVKNLEEKFGVTADCVENVTVSDAEEYLRGFAGDGYSLVIAHGSEYIDATNAVAGEFPDTIFSISYSAEDVSEHDNVICVAPINQGILSGIVLGALTDTNKVAFLGSTENPSITDDLNIFGTGVHLVNPDAEVITGYIGSATDVDKGKEMAMALINSGVDGIAHQANQAGLGVLQAAEEGGIFAVGVNTDQYDVAPGAVVNSVVRNFAPMYEDILPKVVDGTIKRGVYPYGIKDGGCKLIDWHGWDEKLPPEKMALIEDTIQGIMDGTIPER